MSIQLNRIILFCENVETLKHFYQHFFSFPLLEEIPGEWAVLKAGPAEIAFHRMGEAYRNHTNQSFKAVTNTKLVFQLGADISAFRTQLAEKKIPMGEIKSFPGYPYLLCDGEDPEGNVFQLSQATR
jgi:predicted enzyme related to lactoylglutathione lyase